MSDPVVFLPPMMCDARVFAPQIKAFSGRQAMIFAPLTMGDTVREMAGQVLAAAPERFAMLGLAMGGIVAMEVARQAPERITKLCLMDTNPLAETPAAAAAREPQIIAAKSGRLEEAMRAEMRPEYLAPGTGRRAVLDTVMEMADDLGASIFVRQSRALQKRPDQQRTLRRLQIPTLVVCGEHDKLYPVKRHEFLADLIPDAKLAIVHDAGHLPVLEQPAQVNEILRDWMSAPLILR